MFYSFCQTMFNIGQSRTISQANEREQKTKELSIQQMVGNPRLAPCKGIRIPESRNFLLVQSGILGFGIRNPALGIRNPTKDWNPESNLLKIHSRLD